MANINFIVKNDIELKGNLIFEGATKDAFETTLAITDPTADRTITFPNSTGTVALTSNLSSYQPLDADLTAIAGLTSAADALPYFTGSGTASTTTLTTFGRSLIDDADATTARTTLGLGTMATATASSYATLSSPAFTGSPTVNSGRLGAVAGGTSGTGGITTTSTSATITVTHGLGMTPAGVTANVRSDSFTAARTAMIYVGNIGATTFTLYASNGTAGIAVNFSWVAVG